MDATDFLLLLALLAFAVFIGGGAFLLGRAQGYDQAEKFYISVLEKYQTAFRQYVASLESDPSDWWKK